MDIWKRLNLQEYNPVELKNLLESIFHLHPPIQAQDMRRWINALQNRRYTHYQLINLYENIFNP
jgi:hypothetical protein